MAKKPKDEADDGRDKDDDTPAPAASIDDFYDRIQAIADEAAERKAMPKTVRELSRRLEALEAGTGHAVAAQPATVHPTYTVKEAAQLLGKSQATIRRWIREGKLRSTKTSDSQQGQHLIPYASLAPFLHGR
jgi:excisionase family DNA binding protein